MRETASQFAGASLQRRHLDDYRVLFRRKRRKMGAAALPHCC
jgi:hypothetical protein